MNYIMVIDGGGTKSRGCIYDLEGNILSEVVSGFSNIMVDLEETKKNILAIINELSIIYNHPLHTVIGIAGIGNQENYNLFNDWIKDQLECEYTLVTDATLAYFAAFGCDIGILSIVGTGSIHYTFDGTNMLKVGGWGHILGDEGSAYSLSLRVLKRAIHKYELLGNENDELIIAIKEYYNLNRFEDIKNIVYKKDKSIVASLSKFIIENRNRYNLNSIIYEEVTKLAQQIMLMKDQLDSITRLVVSGGLIVNSDYYYQLFVDIISVKTNLHIERLSVDPTYGGYYIYKENIKVGQFK